MNRKEEEAAAKTSPAFCSAAAQAKRHSKPLSDSYKVADEVARMSPEA